MKRINKLIIAILIFTAFTRFLRLDFPSAYVFDEVYHGFTAKQYLLGEKQAWDPFATPPKGVAYEWTHPPLAKEIMTLSMFLAHSNEAWAYRLPGVLLGIISVFIIYLIGRHLLDPKGALIAAFIFSIEGLNFVQSRTGMNDIYFVTFSLLSLLLFLKQKFSYSAIFFGLAISSKWAAIYLLGFYLLFLLLKRKLPKFLFFLVIPPIIYLATYIPYFLQGYTSEQFIELQRQMWWYHTNLKATHGYASSWWSWPLNLYPVWYFVDYQGQKMANIFASGNPIVFWFGLVAVGLTIKEYLKTRSEKLLVIILGFLVFWLPWALSPRIMFLYHYSPSIPFLSLALGYQLQKLYLIDKKTAIFILILVTLGFLAMFPFLTGIPIPKEWVKYFFYTNLTTNPF